MMKVGIVLIPVMPVAEITDTVKAAEDLGIDYCLVADEGVMPDVYICLGAAARFTSRIRLGTITNGYTRHPVVTATALATLNEASGGRAFAALVAGGSLVLEPMDIHRRSPLFVVGDTLEIMRQLWSGENVRWEGRRYRLRSARLTLGPQDIPIWIAARGPRLLELAGEKADGVVLEVKNDLKGAIEIVEKGSARSGNCPARIYLDRIAYTPEMFHESASSVFIHVIMDSPVRQLRALGLSDEEIFRIKETYEKEGSAAAARFVTPEIIRKHQIVGTPEECSQILAALKREHRLGTFLFYIKKSGLQSNIQVMRDIRSIVERAG